MARAGGWADWADPPIPAIGESTFTSFHSVAFGPLADGSPGEASTAQTGNPNGWPVEIIHLKAVGN